MINNLLNCLLCMIISLNLVAQKPVECEEDACSLPSTVVGPENEDYSFISSGLAGIGRGVALGVFTALAFVGYRKWLAPGEDPGVRGREARYFSFGVLTTFLVENMTPNWLLDAPNWVFKRFNRMMVAQSLSEPDINEMETAGRASNNILTPAAQTGRDILAEVEDKVDTVARESRDEYVAGKKDTAAKLIARGAQFLVTRYPEFNPDAEFHARVFRMWWEDSDESPIFVSEDFVLKIINKIGHLEGGDWSELRAEQYERLLKSWLHVVVLS